MKKSFDLHSRIASARGPAGHSLGDETRRIGHGIAGRSVPHPSQTTVKDGAPSAQSATRPTVSVKANRSCRHVRSVVRFQVLLRSLGDEFDRTDSVPPFFTATSVMSSGPLGAVGVWVRGKSKNGRTADHLLATGNDAVEVHGRRLQLYRLRNSPAISRWPRGNVPEAWTADSQGGSELL